MFGRFVPGPPKLLGGPCVGGGIGNRALLNVTLLYPGGKECPPHKLLIIKQRVKKKKS